MKQNIDITAALIEAIKPENLRITVRGKHNRKEKVNPNMDSIEKYGLHFYVTGSMKDATVYKCKYTQEEREAAIENTEKAAVLGTMFEIMNGKGIPVDEWEPDGDVMTVLTTKEMFNGAGVLFCDKVLEKIHKKAGDFYIIPSSIHEVLIVPAPLAQKAALIYMLRTVNRDEVEPEEQLGDMVYLYDGTLH